VGGLAIARSGNRQSPYFPASCSQLPDFPFLQPNFATSPGFPTQTVTVSPAALKLVVFCLSSEPVASTSAFLPSPKLLHLPHYCDISIHSPSHLDITSTSSVAEFDLGNNYWHTAPNIQPPPRHLPGTALSPCHHSGPSHRPRRSRLKGLTKKTKNGWSLTHAIPFHTMELSALQCLHCRLTQKRSKS